MSEGIKLLGISVLDIGPGQIHVLSLETEDGQIKKWVIAGVVEDMLELDDASIIEQVCTGIQIDPQSTGHRFLSHEKLEEMVKDYEEGE